MKALVALAKEKFGKIDAVFANAGIMPAGNMSELKVADWNAMIEINIKGVLNTMAAVLPEFIAKKRDISLLPPPGQARCPFLEMRYIAAPSTS
jgi:NADP-dependent 3-hydroxy acid dehydrogenase YdfG